MLASVIRLDYCSKYCSRSLCTEMNSTLCVAMLDLTTDHRRVHTVILGNTINNRLHDSAGFRPGLQLDWELFRAP